MSSLFELVRLISIKDDTDSSTSPKISTYTWRQHGETSLLALACTNGFIVLRYSASGQPPVVKQLPWPSDLPIVDMCFDPTVTWLLVETDNANLFIIPALAIVDSKVQINQLWRLDDVTIISSFKPRGKPSTVLWWHTLDDQQVAIVATRLGEILFVNLLTSKVVAESAVDAHIRCMELIQDDQQMTTHLLVTGNSGIQWKLLLETRVSQLFNKDTELSSLGYEEIDGRHLPVTSITMAAEILCFRDLFLPMRFYQFQRSVTLSPQYAKGRHFVAAHDDKKSTYQIYDSNIEHLPLFMYRIPHGAMDVVYTDRVMFMASKLSGDKKLLVISNQRAETAVDEESEFNKDAILQQFELPKEEKLLKVTKKSFPFYWHEKREEDQLTRSYYGNQDEPAETGSHQSRSLNVLDIQLTSHTVLDGCFVISDTTVYECRPRVSPERLFLELCMHHSESMHAEQLGISLSLDLNFLFEMAANYLLSQGDCSQAARLFTLSKCPPSKRVLSFAKYGFVQEVMPYLRQTLSHTGNDVTAHERKQLEDLALHCYVHQIKSGKTDLSSSVADTFKEFLLNHFVYEDKTALQLLAENNLEDVLFELAMSRGLVIDALEIMAQIGQYTLGQRSLDMLIAKGFSAHLAQAAKGAFLQCLSPKNLVRILCEKPQLVVQYSGLLLSNLADLDLDALLHLAHVLDPSRPVIRGFLNRQLHSRRRTSSLNSVSSMTGDYGDRSTTRVSAEDGTNMVWCFLMVVLHLNLRRKLAGETTDLSFLFHSPDEYHKLSDGRSPTQPRQKLSCQPRPVGCGQFHAALIRNGDLYTWGSAKNGRLGHGDKLESYIYPPCKVENLYKLQIKVVSVAAGGEHTVALTQQGVYAWGSSKYGQAGLGTRHIYSRPMLIEALSNVNCVSIDCGQYHTMALTENAEIYSWGWGVHGQLGHGDPEDRLSPKLVGAVMDLHVVRIAAGYCHSLIQTKEGELYAFGCGYFGQLGQGSTHKQTLPIKIRCFPERIRTMGTKFFHCIAVTVTNRVYTWGSHPHGLKHFAQNMRRARQSGQSLTEPVDTHLLPQIVDTAYVHGKIKKVICGSFHTCLVTADGDVYAWGRNLDGQIGNGNRQDVRLPSMITQINDRKISHMGSGGEFNVAMDTEGFVLVWGRNDVGQLGLLRAEPASQSKLHMVRGNTKRIHQGNPEVIVPKILEGLPPAAQSSWKHISFTSSTDSADLNASMTEESYDDDQLDCMPSLETIGKDLYGRVVVPVVLKYLDTLCNCNQLLRRCVDLEDWASAASVNLHQLNYSQAMFFHLKAITETIPTTEKSGILENSIQILQYYYKLTVGRKVSSSHKEEELRLLLTQALHHWETHELDTSVLEDFMSDTLDETACILGLLLFRNIEQKETQASEDQQSLSKDFLQTFSSKFCLSVTSKALEISQGDIEKTNPSTFMTMKCQWKEFDKIPADMLGDDKLSYNHLWQDIIQNLSKGAESKKYIYLTRNELEYLDEQLNVSDQSVPSNGQGHRTNAVLFTCGHYYTKKSFSDEVSYLQRELKSGAFNLPESSAVLLQYYNRKGSIPMACPKCVINALPAIL